MAKMNHDKPTYAHPVIPAPQQTRCRTVGEVMAALAAYHPDTPVDTGFGDGVEVTLYNVSLQDEHVEFEEGWDEEEDDEEDD